MALERLAVYASFEALAWGYAPPLTRVHQPDASTVRLIFAAKVRIFVGRQNEETARRKQGEKRRRWFFTANIGPGNFRRVADD